MQELKLYVYRVGHGVFTLLHGILDDGTPFNAVFDCGYQPIFSDERFNNSIPLNGENLKKNVIAHAARIILERGNKKLDFLVCSHQDEDHNNLIMELLQQLNQYQQSLTSVEWFLDDKYSKLLNGYEKATKSIYMDQYKKNLIYKFSRELNGNECEITQTINPWQAGANVYVNNFEAQVTNTRYKDNYSELPGVGLSFTMNLKAGSEQTQGKHSMVHFTKIEIMVCFDGNVFSFESEITESFRLCVWYDEVILRIYPQLYEDFYKYFYTEYDNVIKSLREWLDLIGASYFKLSNVMSDSVSLTNLYKNRYQIAYHPTFKIETAIMGGFSDRDEYNGLCDFLRKYMQEIVPFGNFERYTGYTYINMDCHKERERYLVFTKYVSNTAEEDFENDDDAFVFNSTSTVVNFIYYKSGFPYSVLFPGDITVNHLIDVSNRVRDSGAKCIHILAPHHGSLNTNFLKDESNNLLEDENQPLYIMYNGIIGENENIIVTLISECYCNQKYKTPCLQFVNIVKEFAPKVKNSIHAFDGDLHRLVEINRGVYLTGEATGNCYTLKLIPAIGCQSPPTVERAEKPPRTLPPDYLFV